MQLKLIEGKPVPVLTKGEKRHLGQAASILRDLGRLTNNTSYAAVAAMLNAIGSGQENVAGVEDAAPNTAGKGDKDEKEEPADTAQLDGFAGLLTDFIRLSKRKRELEDDLKVVKAKLADLNDPLAEQMGANGVQRATKDGLTVYLRTDRFVSKRADVDTDQACQVLEGWGWGYIVKESYNASSLRSLVVEKVDDGQPLPLDFDQFFNLSEKTTVGVLAKE
jgi:hypothetical protein